MKSFQTTAMGMAIAGVLICSANVKAAPFSYAFAYDNVFNLSVSSSPSVPLSQFQSFSTTSNTTACMNLLCDAHTDVHGGPADALPANAPGSTVTRPAIPPNTMTPLNFPGPNIGGNFSNSDAQVSRTVLQQSGGGPVGVTGSPNTQAWNVAEGLINTSGFTTSAEGSNSSVTGLTLAVPGVAATAFTFDFFADPFLFTQLGSGSGAGSQAFAALSVVFSITPAGSSVPIFLWAPNGAPGDCIGCSGPELDPFSLNVNTSVSGPTPTGAMASYNPSSGTVGNINGPGGHFSATSIVLPPGSYTLNINMRENITNQLTAVPEPGSMVLLGAGLAAAGWASRRRKVS